MTEVTVSKETVFRGRIIDVEVHQVEAKGGPAVREIVQHGPAVCLVVKRDNGKFIFIKQFRKAMERIVFEVCAGNCDPGEPAMESAKRELTEETGFAADLIRPLGTIYPCVGYCTERIDVFYAEVSQQGETNFDHDEEIETVEVTREQMDELIRTGGIQDGKTLAAWALLGVMREG
jgi:ADP-ribose pyrophosphatase